MTSAALRLATLVVNDPPRAVKEASRLLIAAKQKRQRVAVKAKPRLEKAKLTKATKRDDSLAIRGKVMDRAGGVCELCWHKHAGPLQWHHLVPGPMRRKCESVESTMAICIGCHRLWHEGDISTLRESYHRACAHGAPDVVLFDIGYRINKIERNLKP